MGTFLMSFPGDIIKEFQQGKMALCQSSLEMSPSLTH